MNRRISKGLLIFPILKDLNKADGIVVKNEGIRKGFLENGIAVDTLEFNSNGIFNGDERIYAFDSRRYQRIYQYNTIGWSRIEAYAAGKDYDFIWFRIPIITAYIARFVAALKESRPSRRIILEYGAYPFENELSGIKKFLYRLNRRHEKRAHCHADFVITYCGQQRVDNLINIPINNGIDPRPIEVVNNPLQPGGTVHFISVSSLKKWHAYERFIEGMAVYLQQPGVTDIRFHIVGNGPECEKLLKMTAQLKLEEKVIFHHFKMGKELDVIYQRSHGAIGTLGFHRIGITNSSSLKNREYFARGLPIILSTHDLDMPYGLPYVQYVPEGEAPVDVAAAVAFVQQVHQRPEVNQEIRKYAEERISWKSKVREVLEYLNGEAAIAPSAKS